MKERWIGIDEPKRSGDDESYVDSLRRGLEMTFLNKIFWQTFDIEIPENELVADIGARDGRYTPILNSLGNNRVIAIDPDTNELNKAILNKRLKEKDAINKRLEDTTYNLKGSVHTAFVLNACANNDRNCFINALSEVLTPEGQVVMTSAELSKHQNMFGKLRDGGFNVEAGQLWSSGDEDIENSFPHKWLLVAKKIESSISI